MPRNGSGTETIPNSFTPSTVISSVAVNANFTDVAAELTNSVAVDGQSTMTGSLKAAPGAALTPSLTFGADTDTGLYRKGANQLGFSAGGLEQAFVDSAGMTVTNLTVGSALMSAYVKTLIDDADAATFRATLGLGTMAVEVAANYLLKSDNLASVGSPATAFGNIKQAATTGATGVLQMADQAAMEASTVGRAVTADVQKFHPSAAKCWAVVSYAGGVPSLQATFNVSGVSDDGIGLLTITISTGFSSAEWSAGMAIRHTFDSSTINALSQSATAMQLSVDQPGNGNFDPTRVFFQGWGDQ